MPRGLHSLSRELAGLRSGPSIETPYSFIGGGPLGRGGIGSLPHSVRGVGAIGDIGPLDFESDMPRTARNMRNFASAGVDASTPLIEEEVAGGGLLKNLGKVFTGGAEGEGGLLAAATKGGIKGMAGRGVGGYILGNIGADLLQQIGAPSELGSVAKGAGLGWTFGPWGAAAGGIIGGLGDLAGLWGGEDKPEVPSLQSLRPSFNMLAGYAPQAAAEAREMWHAASSLPADQRDAFRLQVAQSLPAMIQQEVLSRHQYDAQMQSYADSAAWLDRQLSALYKPFGAGGFTDAQARINDTVKSFMAQPLVDAYDAQVKSFMKGGSSAGGSLYQLTPAYQGG